MLKIYDSSLEKYVTVSSNRGDKLYTKSINFQSPELPNYDNDSSIITIDEALTSMSEEIKKNKEGIAWVYKNGTLGGGGGSGSGSTPTFDVTVNNNKLESNSLTITEGSSITIGFIVKGITSGKKITLSITKNGEYIDNYKNLSFTVTSKRTFITINDITENTIISLSGYDSETLTIIDEYQLNIKIANLKIEGETNVSFSYNISSKEMSYIVYSTLGIQTSVNVNLSLYISDGEILEYSYDAGTYNQEKNIITFDIFNSNIFKNLNNEYLNLSDLIKRYYDNDKIIENIIISVKASTAQLNDLKPFETFVSVAYPNRIAIDMFPFTSILNDPEELYTEEENMLFTITLRYNNDSEFFMYYRLYQLNDSNTEINLYESSNNPNDPYINRPNGTAYFSRSTSVNIVYDTLKSNGLDLSKPVYIEVKAWDKNVSIDPTYKTKYFKFSTIDENAWKSYNLAYSNIDEYENEYKIHSYWNQTQIPATTNKKTWSCSIANKNENINTNYIEYYNSNDIVNGLIQNIITNNKEIEPKKLRISSKSYATIKKENGEYFTPFGNVDQDNKDSNWFTTNTGWTISLLYKADIQADSDAVILDYSIKDNSGSVLEGIYITTNKAIIKFRNNEDSANAIQYDINTSLTQNTINQLDIVFKPGTRENPIGKLELYVNGVMQTAAIKDNSYFNYYPTRLVYNNENIPMIFGAKRDNTGNLSHYADFNIYRIIFYKTALTQYHIIKNYIQGHYDVYRNSNGEQDKNYNHELRTKNFFNNNGTCNLCKNIIENNVYAYDSFYTFKSDKEIYELISNGNVLPVVYINVTDNPLAFYNASRFRHSEAAVEADKIKPETDKTITKKYGCDISITNNGTTLVMGSKDSGSKVEGFDAGSGVTIELQGTSTLGFVSKNYQICFGAYNNKKYLVQPFEDMLPENEWILKADIVDSAHANNAAIGKFINEFLSHANSGVSPRENVDNNNDNKYATELKHTTMGHPCIVFMTYAGTDDKGNQLPQYQYQGIYSFNLGRISHFNLGYNVFNGTYTVDDNELGELEVAYQNHKVINDNIKFPALVKNYSILDKPYNNEFITGSPTVCFECKENNNEVGSFQQDNENLIKTFYPRVYPEDVTDSDFGIDNFKKIFTITSRLYECDPNNDLTQLDSLNINSYRTRSSKIRNENGNFFNTETLEYEEFNINNIDKYQDMSIIAAGEGYFNYLTRPQDNNPLNAGLVWDYSSAYFILACLFGLVDSLGKNLNIRSFNQKLWYPSFYDMDTGLGVDNEGKEIIKKDVYLDKFSNNIDMSGVSVYQNSYSIGGFNTINSRLWNIIRNMKTSAYIENAQGFYNTNYRKIWDNLRSNFLKNPNDFIDNYYIAQNKNVGEILFNLDYNVKYINDALSELSGNDISDESSNSNQNLSSSISLLHGNRINFVKDWFPKHVYFLDGVFDLGCNDKTKSSTSALLYGTYESTNFVYGKSSETVNIVTNDTYNSPYKVVNMDNRTSSPNSPTRTFNIKSSSPLFLILNNSTTTTYNRYYIPENENTSIKFKLASNTNATFSTNHNNDIINFDIIKDLNFSAFKSFNYPLLVSFNINDLTTLNINDVNEFNVKPLKSVKEFKMKNVKNNQNKKVTVDLSESEKVNYIDISNSDIDKLALYKSLNGFGGVLEYLNISNTDITELDLTNQTLLTTFNAKDCKKLEKLIFNGCEKLTDIGNIPSNIKILSLNECNSLKKLDLSNMKYLSDDSFILGHLENLKEFTYTKDSKAESYLTELDFSGCPNIEKISLAGFNGTYIILNTQSTQTLKDVNISNSNISYILWTNTEDPENIIYYKSLVDDRSNVLDFNTCVNITNVNIQGNKTIEYVLLPESSISQININILGCDNLRRITGNLGAVNVNKFKNLSNFYFNELCKYDDNDTTSNIIIKDNGDVDFDVSIGNSSLDDNDVNDPSIRLRKYQSKHLLTHYSFIEDGASLDDSFSNTNINISDLYSILLKLKNWKSEAYKSDDNNPDGYITEFKGTFKNCKNIKTYQRDYDTTGSGVIKKDGVIFYSNYEIEHKNIKIDIFNGYNNLKYLRSTFVGCSNIRGHIAGLSDSDESSIFTPAENLTEIDSVFVGCGELYVTSNIFNNNKKLVKISQPFSESTCFSINDTTYYPNEGDTISKLNKINLGLLFNGLNQLVEIDKVFFNTQIVYDFTLINEMFKTTTNLTTIHYILPNNYIGGSTNETNTLSLSNIFGGCYRAYKDGVLADETYKEVPNDLDNLYPRKLTNLDYAFATNGNDEEQPMLNWDNLDYIFYNLDSSINYEVSLESCSYMFDKLAYTKNTDGDGYYNYSKNPNEELAKFPINMFTIKRKDGDIYNDVYFSKLSNIEGLFMRSAFKDELKFPGNIFKYCTAENLNLSHLLEDTIMTPIKLVNEDDGYTCFTNCKLGNISSMFKNCFKGINKKDFIEKDYEKDGLYKLDRGGLHGTIPYKFFKNKGKISNMENVFEGCCHLGTNVNLVCDASGNYLSCDEKYNPGDFITRDETCFYNIKKPDLQTVIDVSNKIKDVSTLLDLVEFDNDVWKWNAWSYDGTTFDSSYLEALNNIDLNGETYIEAKHNNIPNYILIKDENNICSDENGNYVKPKSLNDVSILFNTSSNMWRSLNVDNCFIKFGGDYELNNDGIKCIKIYYDADYDIKNVNFDTKYLGNNKQLWNCDYYTYISRNEPSEVYKHDDKLTATKFISNYAYPMDLFKYCASNCNINSIFKNISRFNNDDKRQKYNDYVYGIIGRIPPKLFDTLTGTINIQNVFEGNKGIVPYSQSFDGQFYNEMFINNTALVNIDGLFTGCMFLGHISDRLFKNNNIKSISELCKNGYMPPEYADNNENHIDYISFVSKDIFNSNSGIQNISGAFSRDNNQDSYISKDAYLYFDLSTDMFAINKHVNISNASKLFENQSKGINRTFTGTGNDIIDFRRWPYIGKNYSNCYSNTNFNLNEIPKDLGGSLENE